MAVKYRICKLILYMFVACWLSEVVLVRAADEVVAVKDKDVGAVAAVEGGPGVKDDELGEEKEPVVQRQEAVQVCVCVCVLLQNNAPHTSVRVNTSLMT